MQQVPAHDVQVGDALILGGRHVRVLRWTYPQPIPGCHPTVWLQVKDLEDGETWRTAAAPGDLLIRS